MADVGVTEEGIVVAGKLAMTWEEVDDQRNLFRFKDRILVKVSFDHSRGHWYDYTLFKKSEWENIKSVLEGKSAWYSDFAGKHSERTLEFFEDVNLEEITDLSAIIAFHSINGYSDSNLDIIGSALDYLQDNDEIEYRDGAYHSLEESDEDEEVSGE